MAISSRSLFSIALVVLGALIPASAVAHPPFAPYDNTRFAPITSFGPSVGMEVVASGLTSPLKGAIAPGQPNRLYVVDQPGILWAIDLSNNAKTVFLDVRSRLVTLGVCGPNTFDERGSPGRRVPPQVRPERPSLHLHLGARIRSARPSSARSHPARRTIRTSSPSGGCPTPATRRRWSIRAAGASSCE